MRILVTGGAGFIGSHLVERLVKDGNRVTVVDRKQGKDITDFIQLKRTFRREKVDVVVHLAAEVGVRDSWKRADDYIKTNIQGTDNVLRLMREFGTGRLIFASSSSAYGQRSGSRGFKETDLAAPISPYAATKVAGEALCQVYAKEYGIKTTVLRLFTVYGPRNRTDMAAYKFTQAISRGQPIKLFGKNTKRDFTFVDDVVAGIMAAIKQPFKFEVINLGNSQPVKISRLIQLIEAQLGKKAKIKLETLPAGDVPVTFANIDKAKKLLGWKPKISLKQGVEKLVNWYMISNHVR